MAVGSSALRVDESLSGAPARGGAHTVRGWWKLWLGLGAVVVLCAGLGVEAVSRTQEARVLEVAREMIDGEPRNWLIPRVNGRIRLQKPPLAYWLTAGCYLVAGVSEGVGRVPAALAGAGTVVVTAGAGAWLFGRRAGFFAGVALLGSYLFYRHARLAETDVLAMLFVTVGVYAGWRGFVAAGGGGEGGSEGSGAEGNEGEGAGAAEAGVGGLVGGGGGSVGEGGGSVAGRSDVAKSRDVDAEWSGLDAVSAGAAADTGGVAAAGHARWEGMRAAGWYHLAAAAIGLTVLSKGPPAAYPVLFLVLVAALSRRWRPLWRFVTCGAPLTAAVIALPWFIYVRQDPQYIQLIKDLKNSAGGGRGHSSLFVTYIPVMFVATAPWSALWVVALVAAAKQWRRDARLRGMVVWVGAILVPLLLWRNKQFHYLMPVMPPLMVLVGWLLDAILNNTAHLIGHGTATLTRRLWAATAIGFAIAAPGVIVAAKITRGWISPGDFAAVALLLAALGLVWILYRKYGPASGIGAFAVCNVVVVAVFVGLWGPSLNAENCRTIVPALQSRYGNGPYAFVGKEDLPMVFHMRRIMPVAKNDAALAALAKRDPPVVVIEPLSGSNRPRPSIVEEVRFKDDKTVYRVGRINPAALASTASEQSAPSASDPLDAE